MTGFGGKRLVRFRHERHQKLPYVMTVNAAIPVLLVVTVEEDAPISDGAGKGPAR